ncbi:MAG: hypothetical protein NVS9B15_07480 [Acidobacteriaceae bacterium]
MEVNRIIAEIDSQIQKLQQARQLRSGTANLERKGPGRPKGSTNASPAKAPKATKQRKLTPEGRKRIAEAMNRRWAERRKQTSAASK